MSSVGDNSNAADMQDAIGFMTLLGCVGRALKTQLAGPNDEPD
jgi:hypothetical protein